MQSLVFIDPSIVLSLSHNLCLSVKLNLPKLSETEQPVTTDHCRGLLSMLNRARSKPHFLGYLQRVLCTKGGLGLIEASRVFMRMNSIYKQASIERQQLKKK
jgi:hypothetical protein